MSVEVAEQSMDVLVPRHTSKDAAVENEATWTVRYRRAAAVENWKNRAGIVEIISSLAVLVETATGVVVFTLTKKGAHQFPSSWITP